MNKQLKTIFIFVFGIILVTIDQISKNYIIKNPDAFRDFSIENFFKITLVKNYGVAFNFRLPYSILYILITVIFIFLLYILIKNYKENNLKNCLAVIIILSGAISNLIDRISLGYVIDFIDIPWFSVFNLADIFIVLGVGLLLKNELFKKHKPIT